VKIKTPQQLADVLVLMRKSQKEAERFHSRDRVKTAKYWEGVVDGFLEELGKKV
jgi:hypothetical protein